MKAVVDTNVIAYFLLGTEPFREECRHFWQRVEHPVAPASWQSELGNVLWMACRHEVLEIQEAVRRLDLARGLSLESVSVDGLWKGALVKAYASGVTVYDTLFVELAERRSLPLVTFDQKILTSFPQIATRPGGASGL